MQTPFYLSSIFSFRSRKGFTELTRLGAKQPYRVADRSAEVAALSSVEVAVLLLSVERSLYIESRIFTILIQ